MKQAAEMSAFDSAHKLRAPLFVSYRNPENRFDSANKTSVPFAHTAVPSKLNRLPVVPLVVLWCESIGRCLSAYGEYRNVVEGLFEPEA